MLKNIKWGEYKVSTLFQIQKITHMLSKERISDTAQYPVYSSESSNSGVIGYTDNPEFICNDDTTVYITFGDHTRTINIAQKSFSVLDNVKVLVPCTNNIHSLLFLVTSWKKQIPNLGYSRHWKVAKKCILSLPQTTSGKIDFAFMESFMRKIEELSLCELQLYLLAAGLNDYQLTPADQQALDNFEALPWQEFKLDNLFEKIDTKKLSYKAKDLPKQPTESNPLPCLTSSFMNQGLNYYVPREGATILNNVISIPSNSDVYRAYYQSTDFTVLSDAYAIRWKDEKNNLTPKQYLFMVACINKVTNLPKYSYKNKLGGWNVVKNKKITLPVTADGKPDLKVMEQLVGAIQKVVIADVAQYTTQQLDAARKVTSQK